MIKEIGLNNIVKQSILEITCILILIFFLISCASDDKQEVSRAHPASYGMDNFSIDNGMPMREVIRKQFYFKDCELESRRAFPNRIEYSCHEH
ncbi:MAG: hypothetical protein L6Q37_04545 [Bdellovibrionaceae bacterium]|nr:hypothetical protein [Pseudobdellovibrionaceae bacterium]NUM59204.1 hypothetical protein [Pseudobdellovibrionaceae bacterium]